MSSKTKVNESNVDQRTATKSGDEFDTVSGSGHAWKGRKDAKRAMNQRKRKADKQALKQGHYEEDSKCRHCRGNVEPGEKCPQCGTKNRSESVEIPHVLKESRPWEALDNKEEDPFERMRRECNEIVAEEEQREGKSIDAFGYKVDMPSGKVQRQSINLDKKGDHGADPLGNGKFKMVPSGDVVDKAERDRRLKESVKAPPAALRLDEAVVEGKESTKPSLTQTLSESLKGAR